MYYDEVGLPFAARDEAGRVQTLTPLFINRRGAGREVEGRFLANDCVGLRTADGRPVRLDRAVPPDRLGRYRLLPPYGPPVPLYSDDPKAV